MPRTPRMVVSKKPLNYFMVTSQHCANSDGRMGKDWRGGQAKHCCVQVDAGRVTWQQFPWTWNTISWRGDFAMSRPCCETVALISVLAFAQITPLVRKRRHDAPAHRERRNTKEGCILPGFSIFQRWHQRVGILPFSFYLRTATLY